jgi:hypothetical protein
MGELLCYLSRSKLTISQWYRDSSGYFGFRHHENAGSMELLGDEGDDEEFGEHDDEEEDTL